MSNFSITDKQILALASSITVYNRGIAYHLSNRVSDFCFDPELGSITATVSGKIPYSVQISYDRAGTIDHCRCDCPAYYEYSSGACKHIVAVLKTLQNKLGEANRTLVQRKQAANALFDFFENFGQERAKEEVTLDLELHILRLSYRISASLELKIGLKRLYVVRDILQLLHSIKQGRAQVFGQQFIFEPSTQAFNKEDQPVIDLLLEMLEHHTSLGSLHYQGSYFSNDFFKQKALPLTDFYLKRLLDCLGDKSFQLSVSPGPHLSNKVIRPDLPLEFSLNPKEQDLALTLNTKDAPLPLTSDGSYFYFQQDIYRASRDQKEFLLPVLNALKKGFDQEIIFPDAQKGRFVSEVLPYIQKTGTVAIDADLASKFSRKNLLAKIYFDRATGHGFTARLEFHYGETVINPFTSMGETRNGPNTEDIILIREVEKERNILNLLEQADFIVNQGEIYLDDENIIYEFIMNYLPQLQDLAEIYYSNEFKGFHIRNSTSFTGRVRLDENLNLLEISFQYNEIEPEELAEVLSSLQVKKRYHRLRDGSFINLNQPELEYVARLLENLDLKAADLSAVVIHLPKYRAMYIDNFLRQANLPGIQRNKAFKQLVQSILEPQDGEYEVPAQLQKVLRDYQKTGFKWLKTLASNGLGGILADDMGLGKTLQVISFILSEKAAKLGPALVIAPTSLVYNWLEEVQKFAPEMKVLVAAGTPQERQTLLEDIAQWDLVVTSYPLIRRDIDIYSSLEFSYCFLDEAQHIKNPHTINAKTVQQIKAGGYFALTGTPIENSLSELWSIFNFVMPGYLLSHLDFRKKYELPIVKGEDPQPLIELGRHASPFILRRLKKDVLKELPDKIETQLKAQMTEQQKKLYIAYLKEAQGEIAREIATVGFERSRIKILAALTRLRQICCHPAMFLENYTDESGKMLLFQEVLSDALDSGHRVLVFSQFTSMLDIIRKHLTEENIPHFYLRGSTKSADRMQMVQAFNQGAGQVFLISLKAGGTGLNLTGADMVIHFDPWWNPAVEEQATDRAHRIGQKSVVQVIKLITQGTIEDKVYALQQKKKALIESVIQPGETLISKMTEEELRGLFL
ncbi:MAG: DEAD/DEAH box helicase [Carboxydocellales bacterium]